MNAISEGDASVTDAEIRHWQEWIGRSESRREFLAAEPLRRYAAATGAGLDVEREPPPLPHWAYFLPVVGNDQLGADGHPARGGFLPPVRLPRRMFAAAELRFEAPLGLGREAVMHATVADVNYRAGRSGELVFVEIERRIEQGGRTCVHEHQTIVFRQTGPRTPAVVPTAIAASEEDEHWTPNAVELFRFSAATFNSHRIHYDEAYTTGEEGYPGLVVHGPLVAARLFAHARRRLGAPVRRYAFRATAPQFVGQTVLLRRGSSSGEFEAVRCDDVVAMTAIAAA
jgi:3-methylfumaryl-CoA hydratase